MTCLTLEGRKLLSCIVFEYPARTALLTHYISAMKAFQLILCRENFRRLGFRRELNENPLFWVITQRAVVIPYRRLGTTDSYETHKYNARAELSSLNVCVGKCVCVCVYVWVFIMCDCMYMWVL